MGKHTRTTPTQRERERGRRKMSAGPKKTWRSGTEHINKPEISKAWQSAGIDADRAEKLHEVPQHLKVGEKVISRSGDVKQPSKKATKKHPSPPIAQPGFKQDLTAKETQGQPKFAQQTEKVLNQF